MSLVWQHILTDIPARWQDDTLLGFTEPAAEAGLANGNLVCPLPGTGIIEATGAEAGTFLQGQLSNDILALDDGESQLAAYCNPKGRMLALFRVVRRQNGYLLLLPQALLPNVLKRLRMYVLRAKVTLTDVSDHWAVLGASGQQAAARLAEQGLELPEAPDTGRWQGDIGIWRLRGEQPRALVLAPAEQMAQLWTALEGLPRAGEPVWRLLDIRAGVPEILPGTQENIIPQMANLDLIGGISFTKGCYPGQEIVARMHYLGNLKRRTYRLLIDGDAPAPGAEVRDANGTLTGEVVMAAPGTGGQSEALAVLQINRAGANDLQVDGRPVQVQPVPYLQEE